ncbi:MAG: hypothetical protein R3C14_28665 [Caldilineaceae bacterium]
MLFLVASFYVPQGAGVCLRCLWSALLCAVGLALAVVAALLLVTTFGAVLLQLGAGLALTAVFALATMPKAVRPC